MYSKFGSIDTEGSLYVDEYGNMYDDQGMLVGEEGDLER
jgi:hypothetical protein